MGLGLMGKGGKSKNLALKGIKEEIDDSEDEDESEDKDEDDDEDFSWSRWTSGFRICQIDGKWLSMVREDLTFIIDEIIKLLQFRKKDKGKPPRKSKPSRNGKNEKPLI